MKIKLLNQELFNGVRKRISGSKQVDSVDYWSSIMSSKRKFSTEERTRIVIEGQSAKLTIDQICAKEGITPQIFYQWTDDFLEINNSKTNKVYSPFKKFDKEYRFNIVIEGKSRKNSVAEICRRENISQDTFLSWNREFLELRQGELDIIKLNSNVYQRNKQIIESVCENDKVFKYFENNVDLSATELAVIIEPTELQFYKGKRIDDIVNLQKVNDIRYINKYFENINSMLPIGGTFIGCLETFKARRGRMKINKIPVVNNLYFGFEFLFNRILPKISFTKKYYFDFTKGNDRLLSKAEGLGRLVSCGFRILDFKSINGILYFVVKKEGEPSFDSNPSYGPIYKMPRIGKNGKIIGVFKFRTMHPYSEYIQDYIVNVNGYAETGKPANDFRIPVWGKFMRRFWLDELPQLYNVLRGDLKLVGIRPVSKRYFQDIPKEMQKLRLTQIPGCIPPYVSLNREGNVMSVLQAEKEYLEEKIRNPLTTDLKYFFKAIYNIVIRHKRSA